MLLRTSIGLLVGTSFCFAQIQTYSNGPFITDPGLFNCVAPVASGDASLLHSATTPTAPYLSIYGYSCRAGAGGSLADDFVVPMGETWTLDTIKVFAYQSLDSTSTTSTMIGGAYRIWCGDPTNGGIVVADHTSSNQLVSTTWKGVYRVANTDLAFGVCSSFTTRRKIMEVILQGNGITLGSGTYWLEYALVGTSTSGNSPFTPPITIPGTLVTGNAKYHTSTAGQWINLLSGLPSMQGAQGIPFELSYTNSAPSTSEFQVNSPELTITLNEANLAGCSAAGLQTTCEGDQVRLGLGSNLGTPPWEAVFSARPAVALSQGGAMTPGGQIFNIDLTDPQLLFVNNLGFPAFAIPFGFGSSNFVFPAPALPYLTLQGAILSPSHPDGFVMSAAAQIEVFPRAPLNTVIAGPGSDDSVVEVVVGNPPQCFGFEIPFFGTRYSRMFVHSNGYVGFNPTTVSDPSPSVTEAANRMLIGSWTNLDPGFPGSGGITVTTTPQGGVSVNYQGVFRGFLGSAANPVTFQIVFDTNGRIALRGLAGVASTATVETYLGISSGVVFGGTSSQFFLPGPVSCAPGSMRYYFHSWTSGPFTPGVSEIVFIPSGSGGYSGFAL